MNESVNPNSNHFSIGRLGLEYRKIKGEVGSIFKIATYSDTWSDGLQRGVGRMFGGTEMKSKIIAGTIMSGGIALAAWGVHSLFDDEEQAEVRTSTGYGKH